MAIVNDPNATAVDNTAVDNTTAADPAATNQTANNTTVDPAVNSLNNNPYIGTANTAQTTTPANVAVDPNAAATNSPVTDIMNNFDTNKFLIGLAIGAAGAYLLTNENAQKAMFKTFAKGSELFTAGIEEMKERFEDAKAEMAAKA